MLGDYVKSNKLIENYQKIVKQLKNQRDAEYINELEKILGTIVTIKHAEERIHKGTEKKIREAQDDLESIVKQVPDHRIANALLSYLYAKTGQIDNYIQNLHRWLKYWSDPFIYEALARMYLKQKDYDKAASNFIKASEIYQDNYRQGLCLALSEFCLGLKSLSGIDVIYKSDLSLCYEHFYKCSALINEYNVESLDDLKVLPSILEISIQTLSLFTISNNLYELKAKVVNLVALTEGIFAHWKSFEQYQIDLKTIGDPASSLLLFTRCYLEYLSSILKIPHVQESIKANMQKNQESEGEYWENNFLVMEKILTEELGIMKSKDIFDILSSFKKKIRGHQINRISHNEAILILNSLKDKSNKIKDSVTKRVYHYVVDKSINFGTVTINIGDQQLLEKGIGKEMRSKIKKKHVPAGEYKEREHERKATKKLKPFKPEDEKFIDINKL